MKGIFVMASQIWHSVYVCTELAGPFHKKIFKAIQLLKVSPPHSIEEINLCFPFAGKQSAAFVKYSPERDSMPQ